MLFTWACFYSTDVEHVNVVVSAVAHDVGSCGVQDKTGITCNTSKIQFSSCIVISLIKTVLN